MARKKRSGGKKLKIVGRRVTAGKKTKRSSRGRGKKTYGK